MALHLNDRNYFGICENALPFLLNSYLGIYELNVIDVESKKFVETRRANSLYITLA